MNKWETTLIDSNEPISVSLTKADIFNYYSAPKIRRVIGDQLADRRTIVYQTFTKNKTTLKRHGDGGWITITHDEKDVDNRNDFQYWIERRATEFHIVIPKKTTNVGWIDIDPKEPFSFGQTKAVARRCLRVMRSMDGCSSSSIKYSGGRGIHILGSFPNGVNVNTLRGNLREMLDEEFADDEDIKTGLTQRGQCRVDLTTLKQNGSIRAAYSLNSKTGLASIPIQNLSTFDPSDAKIENVVELKEYPHYKESSLRLSKRAQLDEDIWMAIGEELVIAVRREETELVKLYALWDHYHSLSADADREKLIDGWTGYLFASHLRVHGYSSEGMRDVIATYMRTSLSLGKEDFFDKMDLMLPTLGIHGEHCLRTLTLAELPHLYKALLDYLLQRYDQEFIENLEQAHGELEEIIIDVMCQSGLQYGAVVVMSRPPRVTIELNPGLVSDLANGDSKLVKQVEESVLHEIGHAIAIQALPEKAQTISAAQAQAVREQAKREMVTPGLQETYRRLPVERSADISALAAYGLALYNQGKSMREVYNDIKQMLLNDVAKGIPEYAATLARRILKVIVKMTEQEVEAA